MTQQTYAQFLLATRSLEDIKYMRDHPTQFSTGTCTLWNITESQRQEAILSVIAVLEKQK